MSLLADLQAYRDRLAGELRDALPEVVQARVPSLEPSENTPDTVQAAAASLPFVLPPSLVEYLTAPIVPGIEWNEIAVPTNKTPDALLELLGRGDLHGIQLAQIGTGPGGDPVCLDVSRPLYDGEYPVVVVSQSHVPSDGWSDAKKVRKSVSLEFSDFGVMLHFCCHGVPFEYRTKFGK